MGQTIAIVDQPGIIPFHRCVSWGLAIYLASVIGAVFAIGLVAILAQGVGKLFDGETSRGE